MNSLKDTPVSRTVIEGLFKCDVAVEGLRMESFTLENEIVFVIEPKEDFAW